LFDALVIYTVTVIFIATEIVTLEEGLFMLILLALVEIFVFFVSVRRANQKLSEEEKSYKQRLLAEKRARS